MPKYLALLRGINVGGKHKVEMKKLREVAEKLGFTVVSSYINSGNLIFECAETDTEKLAIKLERAIEKAFGFAVPTLVRDQKSMLALTKKLPNEWTNDAEQKTDILFVWSDFDHKATIGILKPVAGIDELIYVSGALVWHIERADYSKSAMNNLIKTPVYKKMTARNINTVRKLAELMG